MDRIGAFGLVMVGVALGWLLAGGDAAGQAPAASSPTVCRTFAVKAPPGAQVAPRELNATVAEAHAAEIGAWFDEQAAAGRTLPLYRSSVGVPGVQTVIEVVCVR